MKWCSMGKVLYQDDTVLIRSDGILLKDHMYYLGYPCNCNEGINYRWSQCKQLDYLDICDGFHRRNFKPGVIYPLPVQPLVMSSNKNNNNLSMQPYIIDECSGWKCGCLQSMSKRF